MLSASQGVVSRLTDGGRRCVAPAARQRDRERSVFNLKEQKLAKAYNAVLGINSKDNHDAKRLENWKVPVAGGYGPAVHNDVGVLPSSRPPSGGASVATPRAPS